MAQVTVEGSKTTPTTFLKPGARITVERTPYIDKLIARGYVTLVPKSAPAAQSTEAVMEEIGQQVDEQREAAANEHALTGAPARNALTEEWRSFLKSKGFTIPETATRTEMQASWDEHQASRGQTVD